MKTHIGLAILGMCCTALSSYAMAGETPILPGKIGSYGHYNNTETEEAFSATVIRAHEICYQNAQYYCLALEVIPVGEEQAGIVYLGPKVGFESDLSALEGEDVCVIASRVDIGGETIFIGKAIFLGSQEYLLRTADGRHFLPEIQVDPMRDDSVCALAEANVR